jgi:hypothetical protein
MTKMKSNLLTISSALAALAALPFSADAAGIIFVATGILAVFTADYGRSLRPLSGRAEIIPFNASNRTPVCLRAAA